MVTKEQAEDVELYRPRTELGRKLVELRQKAISEGMDLWDADRIAYEVRERELYGVGLAEAKKKAIRRKILNKLRNGRWDEDATTAAFEEIMEEIL